MSTDYINTYIYIYFQACDEYLSEEQVLKDIAEKKTIRGILRINAKQYTDAFITDPVIYLY